MIYITCSILAGLVGIGIYIYFMRQGQFENCEEIKYQLFHDDEINKKNRD